MKSKGLLLRAAVAVIGLLASAGVAHAVPPAIFVVPIDRTLVDTRTCGFPLEWHDVGTFRIAFHLDAQGDIQWVNVTTFRYRITVTNPATGFSLWTPSPEHILETAFDTTHTGLVLRFVLPGAGLLTLDAGRVIFDNSGDVTINGPHMLLEGDLGPLCAALADGG